MAKNRIEIVIDATTKGLQKGLGQAVSAVKSFGSGLRSIGSVASSVWSGITQGIFFTANAMRELINIGQALFDTMLGGAIKAERFEITLTNITGSADTASRMIDELRDLSTSLGVSFEEAATTGQQLAIAARNADGSFDYAKWQHLMGLVNDFSALRPDVPMQLLARGVTSAMQGDMSTLTRLLDVNVNQLLGLKDAADEVVQMGGQLQGVASIAANDVDAAAQGGLDTLDRLREAVGASGLAEQVAGSFEGMAGQAKAEFQDVAMEFGNEVLPTLTDVMRRALDFYQDHEDEIKAFAKAMGEDMARAISAVDWEQVASAIERIAASVVTIAEWGEVGTEVTTAKLARTAGATPEQAKLAGAIAASPIGLDSAALQGKGLGTAWDIAMGGPLNISVSVDGDGVNTTFGDIATRIATDTAVELLNQIFIGGGEQGGPVPNRRR